MPRVRGGGGRKEPDVRRVMRYAWRGVAILSLVVFAISLIEVWHRPRRMYRATYETRAHTVLLVVRHEGWYLAFTDDQSVESGEKDYPERTYEMALAKRLGWRFIAKDDVGVSFPLRERRWRGVWAGTFWASESRPWTREWVRYALVSHANVMGVSAMAPIVFCVMSYLRRRRAKGAGFCAVCGYDLRATPEGCPGCGTVMRVEA
jgi:hypothetical protein